MRVHVKLFATLARLMQETQPGAPFDVEVPSGATVGDLVTQLRLPPPEVKLTFVNGRSRPLDWALNPDDDVGIFPPVGGG